MSCLGLPQHSAIATDFHTEGDFQVLLGLFNRGPYQIPDHLRTKVIGSIERVISGENPRLQMMAAKLLLIMDKINLDVAKAAIPKKVEHINIKQLSDDELIEAMEKFKQLAMKQVTSKQIVGLPSDL